MSHRKLRCEIRTWRHRRPPGTLNDNQCVSDFSPIRVAIRMSTSLVWRLIKRCDYCTLHRQATDSINYAVTLNFIVLFDTVCNLGHVKQLLHAKAAFCLRNATGNNVLLLYNCLQHPAMTILLLALLCVGVSVVGSQDNEEYRQCLKMVPGYHLPNVRYDCADAHVIHQCDGQILQLHCNDGKRVQILDAFYGRYDDDVCPFTRAVGAARSDECEDQQTNSRIKQLLESKYVLFSKITLLFTLWNQCGSIQPMEEEAEMSKKLRLSFEILKFFLILKLFRFWSV